MKTQKILSFSLPVILLAISAAAAQAGIVTTPISVDDYSFETPSLAQPGFPDSGDGAHEVAGTGQFDATIPYTTAASNGSVGIMNPTTSQFDATNPNNPNGDNDLPGTAQGRQALYINTRSSDVVTSVTYSAADLGNFVIGDTYQLTVAIGDSNAGNDGGTYSVDLLDNGVEVESGSSTAPEGTFDDLSLTLPYVATDKGAISFSLGITGGDEDDVEQGFFDNVRLTQTGVTVATPEPTSMALMIAGLLTFFGLNVLRRRSQV